MDCQKNKYTSRKAAKKALRWAEGRRLRIYLCPHCRHWHLTKQVKPDELARAEDSAF